MTYTRQTLTHNRRNTKLFSEALSEIEAVRRSAGNRKSLENPLCVIEQLEKVESQMFTGIPAKYETKRPSSGTKKKNVDVTPKEGSENHSPCVGCAPNLGQEESSLPIYYPQAQEQGQIHSQTSCSVRNASPSPRRENNLSSICTETYSPVIRSQEEVLQGEQTCTRCEHQSTPASIFYESNESRI